MRNTLKQAIEMYGADMQLNIAIEEFSELTKEICKYKRGADNISHIAEEVADCYIMLEQIKFIFNLDSADISIIMTEKIERLKQRMKNASKCQQNQAYLPCNIGDTVYCVNGYGSQRYIEEFTVAEIRITEDGIWLTDTKGMEWLARVCHFSRESAEKELCGSEDTSPTNNSFFYNRFMKTE